MGLPHSGKAKRHGQAAARTGGVLRRQLLTASFLSAAVSAFSAKALAGKVSDITTPQSENDSSSDEMTAHRRDYYRRARF